MKIGNYDEATEIFEGLGEYKDAVTQAQESQYQKGMFLMVSENYDEATDTFLAMNHLEWDRLNNLLSKKNKEVVEEAIYPVVEEAAEIAVVEVAEAVEDAPKPVEEASDKVVPSLFDQIILLDQSGYKDSLNMAVESQYQKGVTLLSSGDYDGATATFNAISGYNDAETQALESQYQKAAALNAAGKYDEAYTIYAALSGYKDVDSIIENDDNIAAAAAAAAAAWRAQFGAGNTVQFGRYEQDNNTSNGAEAIEWIVLANDGDTATLISKYGLDAKPYNTEYESVTWETCTLRKWLNGEFLNASFSAEEQARLETVTVTADKNPKYNTNPGNDTQDKVFLLSIDEVNTLFSSDDARRCQATAYAKAHGAYVRDSGNSWWWLRTPGNSTYNAAYVDLDGSVLSYGFHVNRGDGVVRPVVVLRLS